MPSKAPVPPMRDAPAAPRGVWLAAALYALLLSAVCLLRWRRFGYGDFDLAVHAQSLHSLLRGSLDCSLLGIPFLGNHLAWLLVLLAPAALVVPPAALLLTVQAALLGLGAVPVYRLAAREAGPRWGAGLAALYLVHPPLLLMNLYEFHPVALVTPFLLFAFDAYRGRRLRAFLAWLGLAVLCQENIALVAAGFGVFALLDRRRGAWAWVPLAAGSAYALLAVAWLLPRWNPGVVGFTRLYGHLGDSLPEVALHLLRHPVEALGIATQPRKLEFVGLLLAPLAYVSLLAPGVFVPVLPVLAQRLLSARPTETLLIYHYQAEFIPFVFAAAAVGIGRVVRRPHRLARPALAAGLVLFTLLAGTLGGAWPGAWTGQVRPALFPGPAVAARQAALDRLPPGVPVLATFDFLPRLADRRGLYSLHHVFGGRYTLSERAYALPGPVDAVLLNTLDPLTFGTFYERDGHARLAAVVADPAWRVAFQRDHVLLLVRGGGGPAVGDLLVEADGPAPGGPARPALAADAAAPACRLLGVETLPAPRGELRLLLQWQWIADERADFLARVRVTDGAGTLLADAWTVPGHRLRPPHTWAPGRVVSDLQVFSVDRSVPPGEPVQVEVRLAPLWGARPGGGGP